MRLLTKQGILFLLVLGVSILASGGLFWIELTESPEELSAPVVQKYEMLPAPAEEMVEADSLVYYEWEESRMQDLPPPPEVTEVHWTDRAVNLFEALEGFLIALAPLLSPLVVYFVQRRQGKYLIRKQNHGEIPA